MADTIVTKTVKQNMNLCINKTVLEKLNTPKTK